MSTVVTGFGTPISPYTVKVTPKISACTGNVLTCNADGLCAPGTVVTVLDTDSIDMTITGSGAPATPYVIHSDVLIQDDGTGPLAGRVNALKLNPGQGINGLYIDCEVIQDCIGEEVGTNLAGTCLVYTDATNKLNVEIDPDVSNQVGCGTGPSGTGLYVPAGSTVAGSCITITGTGSQANPFTVSVEVDPACPLITCGGAGLCVTPTPVTVLDTATVDMNITGTGQPGDPWVLSANACSPGIVVNNGDEPCINMNVVGGTGCGDPFVLNAFPIISPDPCNGLQCRGNGLFIFQDGTLLPDRAAATSAQPAQGPFNGTLSQNVGNPVCVSITNPSPCKTMSVAGDLYGDVRMSRTSGTMIVSTAFGPGPGGPFGASSSRSGLGGPNQTGQEDATFNLYANDLDFGAVGPGATVTFCSVFHVDTAGVVNGRIISGNINVSLRPRWNN